MFFLKPTPIKLHSFKGVDFILKRDDLINKEFSGNKARKIFYYLNNIPSYINTIISYGSLQSNAMYSLSVFSKYKNLNFIYYAHHLNKKLLKHPEGNLKLALLNGMILKEGYENIKISKNTLFIKEGIAQKEAFFGIETLAKELIEQLDKNKEYQIFLPSGTGTTALYLSKALKILNQKHLKVYTTPCVGNENYLKEQFMDLEDNYLDFSPIIINSKKKYNFAKLYKEFYLLWLELQKETKVEFDLLYDPKGWITILENRDIFSNLVYIHQGGLIGNISMLKRYKNKFGEIL